MVGASSAHSRSSRSACLRATVRHSSSTSAARGRARRRLRVQHGRGEHRRAVVAQPHGPAALSGQLHLGAAGEHVADQKPFARNGFAHLRRHAADLRRDQHPHVHAVGEARVGKHAQFIRLGDGQQATSLRAVQ